MFCSFLVGRPYSPRILPVCFAALLPPVNIFCVYLSKKKTIDQIFFLFWFEQLVFLLSLFLGLILIFGSVISWRREELTDLAGLTIWIVDRIFSPILVQVVGLLIRPFVLLNSRF